MSKKEEVQESKKWSQMTKAEKVAAMPEYKKTIENQIKELKKKLASEKRKLADLINEEKALKYDLIAEKAKKNNQNIDDLM